MKKSLGIFIGIIIVMVLGILIYFGVKHNGSNVDSSKKNNTANINGN